MMIPVYFKHLIIAIPLIINGVIGGIVAYFIGIKGTPMSAGFGYTGLVGPINAFNRMSGDPTMNIVLLIFGYLIIPFVSDSLYMNYVKSLFIAIQMKYINLKFLKVSIIRSNLIN